MSIIATPPTTSQDVELSPDELRRYGRHLTLPEVGIAGQKRLKAARVLLVGVGGLGSPLGLYLAAGGIGTLGLVDFDTVDESNLQRQVLFGQADLGQPKVVAARARLGQINPHIEIRAHEERLTASNAMELLAEYDIIADGSDNFPTRYLVNDACVLAGKPCVWGAVSRFEGQVSVYWGARGPCYRCLFPEPPPAGLVPSCAEGGVLGVLPGIIGSLQANEVLKMILGVGESLLGRLLTFDALRLRFRELKLKKAVDCPVCGPRPSITKLQDTVGTCEANTGCENALPGSQSSHEDEVGSVSKDSPTPNAQAPPFEISVQQLAAWQEAGEALTLVDVREPWEVEISHIEGATLIPLREVAERGGELDPEALVVVHCHHGARSAQAVAYLRQQGFRRATNLGGGIEAWRREIDSSMARY